MIYRKLTFGPSAEVRILTIDEEPNFLVACATDICIQIYSQDIETVYNVDIANANSIQFVKGKGCLVALCENKKISLLIGEGFRDHGAYKFTAATFDIWASLSIIEICQGPGHNLTDKEAIPLLTVDTNNGIELIVIDQARVQRTTRTITRLLSENNIRHLISIAEADYEDGKLTAVLLWNDLIQIVRFSLFLSDNINSMSTCSAIFDLDHIICSFANATGISSLSVISPSLFIVTTTQGQFGQLSYNKYGLDLIMEKTVFPYGPFPCKGITKCVKSILSRNKGVSYIISGGLPAVTYGGLNTLSIVVNGEPEICFTFVDQIVNFEVRHRPYNTKESTVKIVEEIWVLTESQVITIENNEGIWKSSNNYHFSSISKTEVMAVSNLIERALVLRENNDVHRVVDDQENNTKLMATCHRDSMIIVWKICNDKLSKYTEINLGSFLNREEHADNKEKVILWPKFQKCGQWKNQMKGADIKINSMKLIPTNDNSFFLLVSIENRLIFHFEVLYQCPNDEHRIMDISNCLKNIDIRSNEDCSETNDHIYIPAFVYGVPVSVQLQSLYKLTETVDLADIFLVDSIITFGGLDGVGLVDFLTSKYTFISSEMLTCVYSNQSTNTLSDIILKRLRKRNSFESADLRKISDLKSPKTILKVNVLSVQCFNLLHATDRTFDLLIGFTTGLIIILSFYVDDNDDIIPSSNYRRLSSSSKDPVISLHVISNLCEDIPANPRGTGIKFSLEDNGQIQGSIDSTIGSSLSTGSKSTNISNDSCQPNTEKVKSSSISRKLSLRLSSAFRKETTDLFLVRCDKNGVKIIDYLKLKTRFKYKIKDQCKNSDLKEKDQRLNIFQAKVFKVDGKFNYHLVLLCNNGVVIKLSLPDLIQISSNELHQSNVDTTLLSLNMDIVVFPRNISVKGDIISEIIVLDEQKRAKERKAVSRSTRWHNNREIESVLTKSENDHEGIDFMKCADPSINSLLW